MDVIAPRHEPAGPRPLGRNTAWTMATAGHWMGLIPPAPHTFSGAGEAAQVSPRIYMYCPGGWQNQYIGECVGCGSSNAAATVLRIPPGAVSDPDDPARDSPRGPNVRLSELWNYYWARNVHGGGGWGEGAVVAYAMDAMMKVGVVPWAVWPNTRENQQAYSDRHGPPDAAKAEGLKHVVVHAARVTGRAQYLDFLAQGYPVVDGVEISNGWMQTAEDGKFTLAGRGVGGHCTLTAGFDKRQNRLYKRNSWQGWGMRTDDPEFNSDDPAFVGNAGGHNNVGYCALDEYLDRFLTDGKLASGETDAFVLNDVPGFDSPKVQPVSAEILFT